MLERLGRGAARHNKVVLGIWVAIVIGVGAAAGSFGGQAVDSFSIPGTDSQHALDVLDERFPAMAGATATVVFDAPHDSELNSGDAREAIEESVRNLGQLDDVSSADNPFADTSSFLPSEVSSDGTIAYSTVHYSVAVADLPDDAFDKLESATEPARHAGLSVAYSGGVVDAQDTTTADAGISAHADDIGLAFAVVILLISLGAVFAMLVPIGTALIGIGTSSSLLTLAMAWFTIGSVAPGIGTMIGLGVGIDYALFIVSRYRQNLAAGDDPITAAGAATARAGSAVLFAGITVCIALAALYLVGIPYLTALGLAAALFVAVAVVAALTLLPALLGLMGRRINSLRLGHGADRTGEGGFSQRWARLVGRRPVLFAVGTTALLAVVAIPLLSIDLGFPDDGDDPKGQTQREAYDLLAEGFGPGVNGPLLVVMELPEHPGHDEAVHELEDALSLVGHIEDYHGVSSAVGPIPNHDADAAVISVTPTTGPSDPATTQLVRDLRDDLIPQVLDGETISAGDVYVGGQTAELIDLTDLIEDRLAWFIGGVVAGAFVLLMMVFRSLLVPLKAAVMNIFSIGAAYGVVVAVFQWGWGKDLIGLSETIPVAPFIPVMMFAVLFGLSMDYEVFLMSRIREEYDRLGDASEAVVAGVARTARVITSAALIMIAVFLAFVTNPSPVIKMIGLGMAVAVLIDATIVRMILVPAVMRLLGDRAWWLPGWLDRILPRLNLDREARPDAGRSPAPTPGTDPRS